MSTEPFNNRTTDTPVPVSRRTAVKIIAGTSLALAISPSLAFAEEKEPSEATAEDPQSLMNSWRYRNGELIDTTPTENGIAPLSSTTPYGQDANGNWCNKYGEPIPGALLRGIDVSEHNGTIDWATVASKGNVDFAIIRCGYGTSPAKTTSSSSTTSEGASATESRSASTSIRTPLIRAAHRAKQITCFEL